MQKLALALAFVTISAACVSGEDGRLQAADAGPSSSSVDANRDCSEQAFSIEHVPARLLLALDMSGSMRGPKYTSSVNAITSALTNLSGQFHFGFNSYPAYPYSNQCNVAGSSQFDTGPNNEASIIAWLGSHTPTNGAGDPLVIQMDALLNDPLFSSNFTATDTGESYLVVVSDGDDCCGPSGAYTCSNTWTAELVERTELLLQAGIKTIVVGYAGADNATMGAIASAGGSPFDDFLPASNEAALQQALETIGGSVTSCTFELDDPDAEADPDAVNIYVDGVVVPLDPGCTTNTGWDWTSATHGSVTLCANTCEQLRDGTISEVSARFGCPSREIE